MQIVIIIIRMSILFWSAIMMSKSFYLSSSFCIMRVFRFCVRHPCWRMKAKLAIVFTYFFGPDGVRAPPVVADGSKSGHCFRTLFLVQACLRAPPVVADEAKPLFSPTFFFFFFFLRLLLFTHFGESPVRENLFPPIFWHK